MDPDKSHVVFVGWHDELDTRSRWSPLKMENHAFTASPVPGTLFLGLDHVPQNWPYLFQWSGVSQDAGVDLGNYPVLMARVPQVQGYAHLDIDVLGEAGEVLNTLRTTTLTKPGISTLDLGASLPAKYTQLRIRLIVGGPNDGCCATYNWVRFVSRPDAVFLTAHPDWNHVRRAGGMLR